MKRKIIGIFSILLCAVILMTGFTIPTSAEKITYAKGANDVSNAYKNSKYYKNLTSIELTGDGVTDTLAVALSQLEYVEGVNSDGFSGTQGGGGNYTEFCRNYGEGSSYAWCAAYVSFCLFQSRANTSTSKNTVWRAIYCPTWYNNMKNNGYAHAASSDYTPQPGDLVFFTGSGHIGIVRYSKNGKVYTIEGNTSNSAGLNPEGGGVYCKSYDRSYGKFLGFGTPPYKKNDKANKVDYTGENPTPGLWIGDKDLSLYPNPNLSGTGTKIPKGTAFEVTKIVTKDKFEVKFNGKTGYLSKSSIYQMTSTGPAVEETEKPITPNKYAVTDDIKKVKEHVGSGITKFTLDGKKINENEVFGLNAGQKLGIEGFAGFSTYIKEFGYYFDGNAESTVWGAIPDEPTADAKKKAGDRAKMFDIDADTTALSNGAHTVTYVVKFLNNKTCDLITLNLDVGGSGVVGGCADESESSSESGDFEEVGCESSVAVGIAVPIVALAGFMICKKKKED